MPLAEVRHPDFFGLYDEVDPIGGAAIIAQNADLWKIGQLDSRGGLWRLNHHHYDGPVTAVIDVQRICDYGKILVASGNVFEHEEVIDDYGGHGGGGGGTPFFNKGYPPIALAAGVPITGPIPLDVQFSSVGSIDPDGGPLTYSWNFGDGSPLSNLPNPAHQFTTGGVFDVRLTVTDVTGKQDSATVRIQPLNILLAAVGNAVFASPDGGQTWAASGGLPGANMYYIIGLASNFVVLEQQVGPNQIVVHRSVDRGQTFAAVGVIPATGGVHRQPIVGHNNRILVPIDTIGGNPGVAYSDDFGGNWTIVNVSVAGAAVGAPSLALLGGNRVAALVSLAAGTPFDTHISDNNGAAWGGDRGGVYDSAQLFLSSFSNDRLVALVTDGVQGRIYTSDNLGGAWVQRSVCGATNRALEAGGADAIAQANGGATPRRYSENRGVNWNNYAAFAGEIRAIRKVPGGWYVGEGDRVHFSEDLPNFALRGNTGAGTIYSLADYTEV